MARVTLNKQVLLIPSSLSPSTQFSPLHVGDEVIVSKLDQNGTKLALERLARSVGTKQVFQIFNADGSFTINDSFNYSGLGKEIGGYPTLLFRDLENNEVPLMTQYGDIYKIRRVK